MSLAPFDSFRPVTDEQYQTAHTDSELELSSRACHTVSHEDLGSWTAEVRLLNSMGDFDCPCCQVPLTQADAEGIPIESCEQCGGLLFTAGKLSQVVQARRRTYRGVEITPQPLPELMPPPQRHCPCCHAQMACHAYFGPGNAIIDFCEECLAVWLDTGELTAIEKAPGKRN